MDGHGPGSGPGHGPGHEPGPEHGHGQTIFFKTIFCPGHAHRALNHIKKTSLYRKMREIGNARTPAN